MQALHPYLSSVLGRINAISVGPVVRSLLHNETPQQSAGGFWVVIQLFFPTR